MRAVVEFVINGIRPAFHPDGGDLTLLGYEDGVVEVSYRKGHNDHCVECVMTPEDLKDYLLESLQERVPGGVKDVVVVADDGAVGNGTSPATPSRMA
jgi:Fe-S cluster biogenesis protein NfuA